MPNLNDLQRRVIGTHHKISDIEVHVSEVTFDGHRYGEVREYVVSLQEYGRGILIPQDMLGSLVDDLVDLATKAAS